MTTIHTIKHTEYLIVSQESIDKGFEGRGSRGHPITPHSYAVGFYDGQNYTGAADECARLNARSDKGSYVMVECNDTVTYKVMI